MSNIFGCLNTAFANILASVSQVNAKVFAASRDTPMFDITAKTFAGFASLFACFLHLPAHCRLAFMSIFLC